MNEPNSPEIGKRRRRPKRLRAQPYELTIEQILEWADDFHDRHGRWPQALDGRVDGTLQERWGNLDAALRNGCRGLPGESSLPQLLAEYRGKRNPKRLPPLVVEEILIWVDGYHTRTAEWPTRDSGDIIEAPGETWNAVDAALKNGIRGLPGNSSLAELLSERREVRNIHSLPPLTVEQILIWADDFHSKHGRWPNCNDGPLEGALEHWGSLDSNLTSGTRGLPGGSSLARMLAQHRGCRNQKQLPALDLTKILGWADAHHHRTRQWPKATDGPILDAPEEKSWNAVDMALRAGVRGLPGGSSLTQVLSEHRGVRNIQRLPPYTISQILEWADAHYARTGEWPNHHSGDIEEAPGESWQAVQVALSGGRRGLPGGSSLPKLLTQWRGKRDRLEPPALTIPQIQEWATSHFQRTGNWPVRVSGAVHEVPGESWDMIDKALREGKRGLMGGSSLSRLTQALRS